VGSGASLHPTAKGPVPKQGTETVREVVVYNLATTWQELFIAY